MAVCVRRTAGPGLRPSLLEAHDRIDKFQCQCVSACVQSVMVPTISHYVPASRTYQCINILRPNLGMQHRYMLRVPTVSVQLKTKELLVK